MNNPDELLRTANREERRKKMGRLRIFLGMCPGVGKTYAMLQSAAEKQREGVSVVVGIVETHGRAETEALLTGLPILPRKKVIYRDKEFAELDIDAVLERRPGLVLVDELAHSNIPGSRHPKRYQDVREILEAGIDVFSTMNVQHLESRIDLVRQITGVAVAETVPDSFFELADQVELIDLPPAQLLKRLEEGKVYLGEMAEKAISGFFQEEHLLALRELALRFTAEVVEGELHEQMVRKQIAGPWQTREKLLVAISHSPYSKRLLRAARRLAGSLEATWIALYVDNGEVLSEGDKEILKKNLDLAKDLGAELVSVHEGNIPLAIRRIAEERNVTQIVMGRPDRRFFRDFVRGGTLLDQLVRETSEIDVHVLRQVRKPRYRGFRLQLPNLEGGIDQYSNVFWFLAFLTILSHWIEPRVQYQAVGFLYLLGVLVIATFAQRGPVIFGAVLSTLTWNYFFLPPKYTFAISQTADIMMCFAYFTVATVASFFTTKIRRQAQELQARAKRLSLLYDFSRELASQTETAAISRVITSFVERTLSGKCAVFLLDPNGQLSTAAHTPSGRPIGDKHAAVANWVKDHGQRAGLGTQTLAGTDVFCLPLLGSRGTLGVLLFFPSGATTLSLEEETTLEAACAVAALTVERSLLQGETQSLKLLEETEKLHQTILDSVSHELRTPITAIMGAGTALQDELTIKNRANRELLTDEILRATRRLNHVVENLLDMSRMGAGKLTLRRDIVDLTESAGAIVREWTELHSPCPRVRVAGAAEIWVAVDVKLFKNILGNLLHNAVTYSPPGGEIEVVVSSADDKAIVEVNDEGAGIAEADRAHIFEKFYRIPGTPAGGMGLGLSIVKGMVEAHGGRISVTGGKNNKGSSFRVEIPLWRDASAEVPHAG